MNQPLFKEFKAFLMRGNVVDLAIAIAIGAAFGAVVKSFVDDIIMQIIAAFGGQPDFSALDFTINDASIRYGAFLNAAIAFLILAAVIFLFVVKPMNMLIARSRKEPPADPTEMSCPDCLSSIPIGAKRCRYCTSVVA